MHARRPGAYPKRRLPTLRCVPEPHLLAITSFTTFIDAGKMGIILNSPENRPTGDEMGYHYSWPIVDSVPANG